MKDNLLLAEEAEGAALRAVTYRMPLQPASAGDFVRRMRDEDRY